jgi:anti-sigma regulatory factor (Ser/Thr protein kinase)
VAGISMHLDPNLSAPAVARAAVRRTMGGGDGAEVAELLVTELVTNVLRHGSGDGTIDLTMRSIDGAWVVEVHGRGTIAGGKPDVGGFGLVLVDRLADDWGIDGDDGFVRSWFRIGPSGPTEA